MKYILIALILSSCGVGHEVSGLDQGKLEVTGDINPDFQRGADFCDARYDDENKAEECFRSYRSYYKIEVTLDLDSIVYFCEERYTGDDIDDCIDNLIGIMGGV